MEPAPLPFFIREKDHLKVFNFVAGQQEGLFFEQNGGALPLPLPKSAAWCPNGTAIALVDPAQGVLCLEFPADIDDGETVLHVLDGSSKTTQGLSWSPLSSHIVTISPAIKGSQEPNVQVWRRGDAQSGSAWAQQRLGTGEYSIVGAFHYAKLERDKKVLQWTADESYCLRLCLDGKIHVMNGGDIGGAPLLELTFEHPVASLEIAPMKAEGDFKARIAVFVPDTRDDLQRVKDPAQVTIWDLTMPNGGDLKADKCATSSVPSGQNADLHWNFGGSALLAHCMTEVDETGSSYYGGSRLVLISSDGTFEKDLTEEGATSANATSIQDVAWSPTRDEFILIQGFQPAQASLWKWDQATSRVLQPKVLLAKAHRNTIRFNRQGSLVCIAGFGNLAGQVDFFGRTNDTTCDYLHVSSCTCSCTVASEWAADGRHFLTAVLAPRMRVDNAVDIWDGLQGSKVCGQGFEELFDAQWRPEPSSSSRFITLSNDEIKQAADDWAKKEAGDNAQPKKQAYKPPRARGEVANSSVAAMMRGEMAAPEQDDRRIRKPRANPKDPPAIGSGRDQEDNEKTNHRDRRSTGGADDSEQRAEQQEPKEHKEAKESKESRKQSKNKQAEAKEVEQTAAYASAQPPAQPSQPAAQKQQQQRPPPPQEAAPPRPNGGHEANGAATNGAAQAALLQQQQAQAAAQEAAMTAALRVQATQEAEKEAALWAQNDRLSRQAAAMKGDPTAAYAAQQAQMEAAVARQQALEEQRYAEHYRAQLRAMQAQQAYQLGGYGAAMAGAAAQAQANARAQAQQAQAQARVQAHAQAQINAAPANANGKECPKSGWQYVDPKGAIQGPFSLTEMQQWNMLGYFKPDLKMRCSSEDAFRPFAELFPTPLIPFHSHPERKPSSNPTK